MDYVALFIVLIACVSGGVGIGWWAGRSRGIAIGRSRYISTLKFEKREIAPLEPTDQPHSRRPKGPARITTAHVSQPRADWSAPSDD